MALRFVACRDYHMLPQRYKCTYLRMVRISHNIPPAGLRVLLLHAPAANFCHEHDAAAWDLSLPGESRGRRRGLRCVPFSRTGTQEPAETPRPFYKSFPEIALGMEAFFPPQPGGSPPRGRLLAVRSRRAARKPPQTARPGPKSAVPKPPCSPPTRLNTAACKARKRAAAEAEKLQVRS